MSKVVLVVISVIGLSMIYLGIAATLCVVRDRSLARKPAVLRILVSWFVPLLGPIFTIRIAAEESPQDLRSRWWLWPLRPMFSEERPDSGFAQVIDMRADAERILPGSTFNPPP
ncbi:MAG: hypothetical protein ABSG18_22015 [Steroidobacteraceae bacterium]|jgi:hypothetical protein